MYGFISGRSTVLPLITTLDNITFEMDKEHYRGEIINDLPDLTKSNTLLIAHDIKIFRPMMNRGDHSILQQDITIIEQLSDNWML